MVTVVKWEVGANRKFSYRVFDVVLTLFVYVIWPVDDLRCLQLCFIFSRRVLIIKKIELKEAVTHKR